MNTENQTTSGDQELIPEWFLRKRVSEAADEPTSDQEWEELSDDPHYKLTVEIIKEFGELRYQQGIKDAEQSKWIPVEERLPVSEDMEQEAIKVLASFKSGSVTEVFYNFYTGTWENFERWKYSNDPPHWQPLPSAPDLQEQGKEKE